MRKLDKTFIDELKVGGIFRSIVDYVENPVNEAILCIRENYVNVYYKAHSLLKIVQDVKDREKYIISFDLNHSRYTCGINGAKGQISNTGISPRYSGHFLEIIINKNNGLPGGFWSVVRLLKNYINDYFDINKKFDYIRYENGEDQPRRGKYNLIEKVRQQEIYSLGMRYKANGYICYDRESAIEREDIKSVFGSNIKLGQPDCLFAKIENGVVTKIIFVEVKSTEGACKTNKTKYGYTSGMVKHDNDFNLALNNQKLCKILKDQMIHAFEVFGQVKINGYPQQVSVADELEFDKHYVFTDKAKVFMQKNSKCQDALRIKDLLKVNKIYVL